MADPFEPETKKCTICQQPYPRQWGRADRTTCSNKCRQQAHRNRVFAEREAHRVEQSRQWQVEHDRRDKANAARRKRRKAAKPRRRSKT